MEIKQAQKIVDDWIKDFGVRYFSETNQMLQLTEEVGELARVVSRIYGEQSFKKGEKGDLADEIADVLFVLICLANSTGINLEKAFKENMEKKTERDSKRHKENTKLKL